MSPYTGMTSRDMSLKIRIRHRRNGVSRGSSGKVINMTGTGCVDFANKGNNKITELRTILQRESPNS